MPSEESEQSAREWIEARYGPILINVVPLKRFGIKTLASVRIQDGEETGIGDSEDEALEDLRSRLLILRRVALESE